MVSFGELEFDGFIIIHHDEGAGEFAAVDNQFGAGVSLAVKVDFSPEEERTEPDGFIELVHRKLGAEGLLDVWSVLHGKG